MKALKERWTLFFNIMLDPWSLLLIVGIFALFSYSTTQSSITITSLLFVLITITSTIFGGRVTKQWTELTEGGIVIARGKSAVRNLKLLLRNIEALEKRVLQFNSPTNKAGDSTEITNRNYEEIVERCNLLQEETINSIENWTDIVPEADIKTQIGILTQLKFKLEKKENELIDLKSQIEEAKGRANEDKIKLKEETERQIADLEQKWIEQRINLATSPSSLGLSDAFKAYSLLKRNPQIKNLQDVSDALKKKGGS